MGAVATEEGHAQFAGVSLFDDLQLGFFAEAPAPAPAPAPAAPSGTESEDPRQFRGRTALRARTAVLFSRLQDMGLKGEVIPTQEREQVRPQAWGRAQLHRAPDSRSRLGRVALHEVEEGFDLPLGQQDQGGGGDSRRVSGVQRGPEQGLGGLRAAQHQPMQVRGQLFLPNRRIWEIEVRRLQGSLPLQPPEGRLVQVLFQHVFQHHVTPLN